MLPPTQSDNGITEDEAIAYARELLNGRKKQTEAGSSFFLTSTDHEESDQNEAATNAHQDNVVERMNEENTEIDSAPPPLNMESLMQSCVVKETTCIRVLL